MKLALCPLAVALSLACSPAVLLAQDQRVFNENEITVESVADSLQPIKLRGVKRDGPARSGQLSVMITFKTNSSELAPEAKKALDVVGQAFNSERLAALKFAIEGHADPRGGHDYNMKLSQHRAESVLHYLEENSEVKGERLQAVGRGDTEPVNPSDPTDPRNRRVTFRTVVQ